MKGTIPVDFLDTTRTWHFTAFGSDDPDFPGQGMLVTPLFGCGNAPYFIVSEDEGGIRIEGEGWIVPESAAEAEGRALTADIGRVTYRHED